MLAGSKNYFVVVVGSVFSFEFEMAVATQLCVDDLCTSYKITLGS